VIPKSTPAGKPSLFPDSANQDFAPDAGLSAEFQELYSLGMDRALGFQKASFEAAVRMQSEAIQTYKDAALLTPALNNLFENLAHALAAIMQLQMKCLSLMAPGLAPAIPASLSNLPTEVLEHSIEIASGQKKRSHVASHMAATVQPKAKS
jgi:hypothetical protein